MFKQVYPDRLMTEGFYNLTFIFTGIVGEIDEKGEGYYLWTTKKFDIGYNDKQIVDVNLTSEEKVKLEPGAVISFKYEVSIRKIQTQIMLT